MTWIRSGRGRPLDIFLVLAGIVALAWISAMPASACSGCGCRGGPGYRGPNGRCVSWANIGRVCGSPPGERCSPEAPNAGAEEAARLGVRPPKLERPALSQETPPEPKPE
ncbi:MAG TPA: hypothetical protein VGN75_15785 [Kaistia sp.]|jgi:hypothetical protein|nr:hypothetical protein [Kaistia sp.]